MRRAWPDVAAVVVALAAVALAVPRTKTSGDVDLHQFYVAGSAVLHGKPIYAAPFPYPPFAALAFAPLALLGFGSAVSLYSVVQVVVPTLGVGVTGLLFPRRYRYLLGAVIAVLLLKADVYTDALFLHNPSLLFVLPLSLALLAWQHDRGRLAMVIIGVSVAIKPLLVLLLLIPLLQRRWRDASWGLLVAGLLTIIGLGFSHDLSGFVDLPGELASGTSLHGGAQVYNVSLTSLAVVHPGSAVPIQLIRGSLALAVVAVTGLALRRPPVHFEDVASLAGVYALVLPVVGSIGESHYAVLAAPVGAWVCLHGRVYARYCVGAGLIVLWVPVYNLHLSQSDQAGQWRWATGLSLCLAGFLLDYVLSNAHEGWRSWCLLRHGPSRNAATIEG